MIAGEHFLELLADGAIKLLDVFHVQAFAVWGVGDKNALFGSLGDVFNGAAFELDVASQSRAFDVFARDGHRLALDVAAIDFIGELAFAAVVVVNA